jgi:hypothetical protein
MQKTHGFDKVNQLASGVVDGKQLDIYIFLTARRVMQVQYAAGLAGLHRVLTGARFPALVARLVEVMRHVKTGAADDFNGMAKGVSISRVGAKDAEIWINQDARLGQRFKQREEFTMRRGRNSHASNVF